MIVMAFACDEHGAILFDGQNGTRPIRNVDVYSVNPSHGVVVRVAPRDRMGRSSIATPGTLLFESGTLVTLVVNAVSDSGVFDRWESDRQVEPGTCEISTRVASSSAIGVIYRDAIPRVQGLALRWSSCPNSRWTLEWTDVDGADLYEVAVRRHGFRDAPLCACNDLLISEVTGQSSHIYTVPSAGVGLPYCGCVQGWSVSVRARVIVCGRATWAPWRSENLLVTNCL